MKKSGFTLVEILIVVIILGILAAIVIPQFTSASESAKESNLKSDLLTLRNQLELYRVQHGDRYPWEVVASATSADIVEQLTSKTDESGSVLATGKFGPYLDKMPTNLFVKDRGGATPDEFDVSAAAVTVASTSGDGWIIDTVNNKVYANSDPTAYPDHFNF